MKLYAPRYYKDFKCIADKCPHSCCVGWEIDIDGDTLDKYKNLCGGYGDLISDSISVDGGTPHFTLGAGERCPHLDERGLCRIITSVGEDYLCDICREHPRFYNFTSIAEVGLGMSCPAAARLILSSPSYAETEEIGERCAEADAVGFDGIAARGEVYATLGGAEDYTAALERIYCEYSIDKGEDREWLLTLDSLEYLDAAHKELFLKYSSALRPTEGEAQRYLERFLAYLIYRHATEAGDGEDFCERLAFCLFCERLLSALICTEGASNLDEVAELARVISEEIEYSEDNTAALIYR
ncbi:MAG: flagellin lysine-N-methylase [Clostridia bacterium]|nr:flagellin lysine-N-methylase [Clostridia bacterium]